MAYTVIGRIRPRPMGAWRAEAAYEALDVVMHPDGAKAYMAVRDVPAGAALADGEYWAPVADVSAAVEAASAAVESIAAYREQLMCRVRGETEAAQGTLVRMSPDAGSLVRAVSHMEPVQAGEGTPSPDNLRAISGRTGLRLVRCGRNLLENTEGTLTKNGVTFTVNADGSITANGTATADAPFVLVRNLALPDGAYVLSGCPNGGLATTFRLYAVSPSVSDYGNGATLAVNGTKPTVAIMIRKGYTADNLTFHPMLRPASDADATYAPYGGDTFAVDFGQTVYGGRLDWATGVLTAEWACRAFDGTEGWTLYGADGNPYFILGNAIDIGADTLLANAGSCSHFPFVNLAVSSDNQGINGKDKAVYLRWSALFSTVAELKAYLSAQNTAGTPVQVAYRLATPAEIHVAPQLIAALEGENLLYGDAEFDAEWVRPLKASIEARTGVLEERSDALDARAGVLEARIDAVTPDDSAVDGKPWTSGKIVEALCPPFETTGSIVQCHPVEHYPLGVVSRIDATQSGNGDASPDNIRPIVGWDSVSLNRCGKNISKSNAIGSVAWAGTDANTTKLINSLPAGTYQISFTMTLNKFSDSFTSETIPADGLYASYRLNEGTPLMSSKYLGTVNKIYRTDSLPKSVNISETIVINEEDVGCKKQIYFYGCGRNTYAEGAPNGPLGTASVSNLQIELGSTATPYEPYTSDTYTATLPETIYGGELDWSTGVLTVTQKHYNLPISEMNNSEEFPGWINVEWVLDLVNDGVDSVLKLKACNISRIVRANTINGNKTIYFIKSDLGGLTQTEIKETYPDLMVEFVAYLLTPYTVQLTPQQIAALTGINTLYTDSGDTAVSGRADPVWLTQSLMERIAALESAATNI